MESNENNQTPILYGAFALVLLAALAFAPSPAFILAGASVLLLFYHSGTPPSDALLRHEAHI